MLMFKIMPIGNYLYLYIIYKIYMRICLIFFIANVILNQQRRYTYYNNCVYLIFMAFL